MACIRQSNSGSTYDHVEESPRVRIVVASIEPMNRGRLLRERNGQTRSYIQEQSIGAVVGAGERFNGSGCTTDWRAHRYFGALAG